jgi:HK97 family phage prohead protease
MQTKRKPTETSKPIHYKSLGVSDFKVDEGSRTISGYAAVWNNIDDARDMLLKGCCSKSITERGPESTTNRKIAFLWQHHMSNPVGRIVKLLEDETGLYFEVIIDKIPEGDRTLTQLKSGTLNQFSIGYMYVWNNCEWDSAKDCFVVKEINLFEVSVVTMGANEETGFEGMKSADIESERNQILRDTERAIKGLPYETQIEIRQLISKHIALAEAVPTKSHKQGEPQDGFDFSLLSNAFKNNQ